MEVKTKKIWKKSIQHLSFKFSGNLRIGKKTEKNPFKKMESANAPTNSIVENLLINKLTDERIEGVIDKIRYAKAVPEIESYAEGRISNQKLITKIIGLWRSCNEGRKCIENAKKSPSQTVLESSIPPPKPEEKSIKEVKVKQPEENVQVLKKEKKIVEEKTKGLDLKTILITVSFIILIIIILIILIITFHEPKIEREKKRDSKGRKSEFNFEWLIYGGIIVVIAIMIIMH